MSFALDNKPMPERMSHAEYIQLQRTRALEAARAIASGRRSIIEGCRYLTGIRFELELPELENDFNMIVGIESESDHLPVGETRKNWAADALEKKDIEIADFEDFYRKHAVQACSVLIPKLEKAIHRDASPDAS